MRDFCGRYQDIHNVSFAPLILMQIELIQQVIDMVCSRSRLWFLPLPKYKCFVFRLGKSNSQNIFVNDTTHKYIFELRDLGFLLCTNLCFNSHCNELANFRCKYY